MIDPTSDSPTSPGSATLSLLDLRRHLLRRSGELKVRARSLRTRGHHLAAARVEEKSQRLLQIARSMGPTRE